MYEQKHKKMKKKRASWLWISFVGTFLCCILYFTANHNQNDIAPENAMPFHVRYNEVTYIFRGTELYVLPEGYEFSGATRNVGNGQKKENFDSNVDGYIYANPNEDNTVVFRWNTWDAEHNGREPYLLMIAE